MSGRAHQPLAVVGGVATSDVVEAAVRGHEGRRPSRLRLRGQEGASLRARTSFVHVGPVRWGRRGRREGALPRATLCARTNANEHTSTRVGETVEQHSI
jgi:hypothetical protein